METHGSRPSVRRQEIRCPDCAHRYLIAEGQLSSRCAKCGNVVVTSSNAVAQSPSERAIALAKPDPLAAFQRIADGQRVQEILTSYQVEWQLWAKLVQHFADPEFHAAYISQATAKGLLSVASDRYREHRSVMTLIAEERWQAEVADLMLARVEQLSLIRLVQSESAPPWYRWLAELTSEPLRSRALKLAWVVAGMVVGLRWLLPLIR